MASLACVALANPVPGTNPTPAQVAEARAAVAERDKRGDAPRPSTQYDNQICVASAYPTEARATPYWTWKGFWQVGYTTYELGKTFRNANGAFSNTNFCQCWQDHRAWGDNWRVSFALPNDPAGIKAQHSESFSMGENSRAKAVLVLRDKGGSISVRPGDCSAVPR